MELAVDMLQTGILTTKNIFTKLNKKKLKKINENCIN